MDIVEAGVQPWNHGPSEPLALDIQGFFFIVAQQSARPVGKRRRSFTGMSERLIGLIASPLPLPQVRA